MSKQIHRLIFITFLSALLFACGGGGGGDGGEGVGGTTDTINVAGKWAINETINDQACGGNGDTDSYSITVSQDGTGITVVAPNGTFSGTLSGSVLSWTGQYQDFGSGGWVSIISMSLNVSDNSFSGTTNWDWGETQNGSVVCSGSTQVTGSKIASIDLPAAPSNLKATTTSESTIDLTWTNNTSDELGIIIERSTSEFDGYVLLITAHAGVTSYTDNSASPSTIYYYRIRAYNSAGDSAYSSVASATSSPKAVSAPVAPDNFQATASSTSSITLSWLDVGYETGYRIERSTNNSNFSQIGTVAADVTRYNDTGLSASTRYYYRVRAYNSGGNSNYSLTRNATTNSQLSVPSAPIITATSISGTSIRLDWADDPNTEYYSIERGTSPGSFVRLLSNTIPYARTTYTDRYLTPGTRYYYRMRAHNGGGASTYSTVVNATTATTGTTGIFRSGRDHTIVQNSTFTEVANTAYPRTNLRVGCYFTGPSTYGYDCGYAMIWFNIDSIIDGKTIETATLTLYPDLMAVNGPVTYQIAALATAWNGNTTYNNFSGWLTYNANKVDFSSPISLSRPIVIDVTNIVQAWANNSFINYGLIIEQRNINFLNYMWDQQTEFLSADTAGGETYSPSLSVTYR